MKPIFANRLRVLIGAVTAVLAVAHTGRTQPKAAPERFTAVAVNMTNQNTGGVGALEIVIDRWSSETDRDALAIAGQESGFAAVTKLLQDGSRIGFVRMSSRIGTDVKFARDVRHSDGSRRVVIVVQRRLGFSEVNNASPTVDYPLTVIELHLDPRGVGEGTMTVGAKVTFQRGIDQIDTDKYMAGTIRLKEVRVQTK